MISELEALAQRLEEVEKQVAHLATLVVAQSDKDRTVVARSFVVKDARGQRRAALDVVPEEEGSEGAPSLELFDVEGNKRACLAVSSGGASLHLFDAKSEQGLQLLVSKESTRVGLFDANGKQRLTLKVVPDKSGAPVLVLFDANGEAGIVVTTLDNGPIVGLFDPANTDGNTSVRIQVESGRPSLLFVKDGKVLGSAP